MKYMKQWTFVCIFYIYKIIISKEYFTAVKYYSFALIYFHDYKILIPLKYIYDLDESLELESIVNVNDKISI